MKYHTKKSNPSRIMLLIGEGHSTIAKYFGISRQAVKYWEISSHIPEKYWHKLCDWKKCLTFLELRRFNNGL